MTTIEKNPYLQDINPYLFSQIREVKYSDPHDHTLVSRIVDYARKKLFKDPEKYLDFIEKGTVIADWGTYGLYAGLQGFIFVDNHFEKNIAPRSFWKRLPLIFKLIALPLSIFMFVFALIEAAFEANNIKRTCLLIRRIEKADDAPHAKLQELKNRYFSLCTDEISKIQSFIETSLPKLSLTQKSKHFDQIAEKALRIRYATLQRRITPWLAEEIKGSLDKILKGLKSSDEKVNAGARSDAEKLLETIDSQAKKKIIVHILALIVIAFTIFSTIGLLTGLTAGVGGIVVSVLSSLAALGYLLFNRGIASHEGWYFSFKRLLPEFIQKRLFRFPKEIELPSLAQRVTA